MTHEQWMRKAMILLIGCTPMSDRNNTSTDIAEIYTQLIKEAKQITEKEKEE